MTEITKQKAGKPEWSLIMRNIPLALLAMIDVRRFGCEKYGEIAKAAGVEFDPEAWRKNSEQDYLDSAQRHVAALMRGEWTNTEDGGVLHAAQAMIDLAFMLEIRAQREACRIPEPVFVDAVLRSGVDVERGQLVTADMLAAIETFTEPPSTQRSQREYLWADGGQELTLRIASPADLPPLRHMVETLSRKKRWADHCANAISVTRHHIHVKRIVDRLLGPGDLRGWADALRRAALSHDMAEALYGDKPTPQKRLERSMLPDSVAHPHDVLCEEFDNAFQRAYDTAWMNHTKIKRADGIACCLEAVDRGVTRTQLCDWFPIELVTDALEGDWRYVIGPSTVPDTEVWFNEWHNAGGKTL